MTVLHACRGILYFITYMRSFNCYGEGCQLSRKKRFEGVWFNVITVMRGWVGVPFPGKKHYVTLEWPQCHAFNYSNTDESITFELRDSCEVWVAMDVDLGVDGCVGVSEQFLDAVSCDGS